MYEDNTSYIMGKIPITPQMLRAAVKQLQMRQVFVKLKNLREYIQKYYPVETDFDALEKELQEKLKYAVCVGLLIKHGNDQYCIPTLRQEASTIKTAISAFWELYKDNNRLSNTRKSYIKPSVQQLKQKGNINSFQYDESDSNED